MQPHPDTDADDLPEFWIFTDPGALPTLDELQDDMFTMDSCARLKSSGKLETLPDGIIEGECLDEQGASGFDVWWEVQIVDARKAFKKDRRALQSIGSYTQMLIFTMEDDCALGHVFTMMHALLSLRPGLLAILDGGKQITLDRRDALAFLEEEIKDNLNFSDET